MKLKSMTTLVVNVVRMNGLPDGELMNNMLLITTPENIVSLHAPIADILIKWVVED